MADYTLYLVTDRHLAKSGTVEEIVEKAIAGGCTMVQLREKEGDTGELLERALRVKAVTEKYHVPLIIDDRIDVMMAAEADGVHVGQSDMPAAIARKMIGSEKILGVSAGTLEEALKAEQDGADYLGVGAMYQTATKTDADLTTMETLKEIKKRVHIPVVAIGGINGRTIPYFKGTGIDGFAIASAIMAADDPEKASIELKDEIRKTLDL